MKRVIEGIAALYAVLGTCAALFVVLRGYVNQRWTR